MQASFVPGFEGSTTVDLQVPCTFDFNVAATKYFEGLSDGDIPLRMMFSGTVFYADEEGALAGGAHLMGAGDSLQTSAKSMAAT